MTDQPITHQDAEPLALDADRQVKAKEYSRIRKRLLVVDLALGAIYIILWLALGLHTAARDWVYTINSNPYVAIALYALVFGVPYFLIDLPLSFYSGYILPHRYGQSTQTLGGWITDQVKSLALTGVLGLILLEVVYWLLRARPDDWWLFAAAVMLFFTVVLSSLAPVLIAPLFFKFTPLEDQDLANRLIRLAERAGTRVKGVYRFDMSRRTKSANAALMGLGATRRIVLGDTLLDEFTYDEIETVLAHELAHQVHRDIPVGIAVNSVLTLFSFWIAHLALTWSVDAFDLTSISDPAGLPIFGLVTAIISLIAMPLGNAYSRWRERLADRYALQETRKPQAFANAMTRLANQNLADADPAPWEVFLLYSHPPIRDRVAAAQEFTRAPG
jgi:STE24 endopeptidase